MTDARATYFRSLHWAWHSPLHTGAQAGACLWWKVRINQRLQLLEEVTFSHMHESLLCEMILAKDRRLLIPAIAYTVAQPSLFPKNMKGYKGFIGQYVAETLAFYGVPVIQADDDELNGWARVHALLRPSPDGEPWLMIAPSCETLIKALGTAMSEEKQPDEIADAAPVLRALRYGAMTRPAPDTVLADTGDAPFGTPRYYMQRAMREHQSARPFGGIH